MKILVVCHEDGYLEIFTDERTQIHVVAMPAFSTRAQTARSEIAAESVLDRSLPCWAKVLYEPLRRRWAGLFPKRTPKTERTRVKMSKLHALADDVRGEASDLALDAIVERFVERSGISNGSPR